MNRILPRHHETENMPESFGRIWILYLRFRDVGADMQSVFPKLVLIVEVINGQTFSF